MSNEGFTVRCNKCGKVVKVADKKDKYWGTRDAVTNKKGIEFCLDCCNEQAYIKCECGNTLIF
ncbi:hypothetical protein KM792_13740 [Clostridium tyrobutyricum]|uniref:hypothetical protein n=1 Tax=Clostridium tyrobutyricum TaxID=1519 RepID=UPI001C3937AF|nr:hypothetical protein [Clostridium tyrobutyricum]MBV4426474.1 hypothetical protein [Clostridium tyrobutyricum]MBV4429396.1 hypothetical protein [Clostridium tyrobutyricum]MBV4443023.1 hypothetical protein [Clostridium tyrobutyricum]MBV4450706.1 hypothetical protein [Clostridium tyrobutyricum]